MSTQYLAYLPPTIPQPQLPAGEATRSTLLENDEVLVVSTTYPPGGRVPVHAHRFPSVVCVVEGGRLETTNADGTVDTYELRPGETLWSGTGSTHSARNVGSTPIRIIEVEVKHATPATGAIPTERVLAPDDLEWIPDPIDARRSAAMLVGDPQEPGPYTVRYRAPAGYELGLHVHPEDNEQLTVISGTLLWSAGAPGSGAQEYILPTGGFVMTPAGMPHRVIALTDTVLQMSGDGPHTYVYPDRPAGYTAH